MRFFIFTIFFVICEGVPTPVVMTTSQGSRRHLVRSAAERKDITPKVLLFGCSVDRFALVDYCAAMHGSMEEFSNLMPAPQNEARRCKTAEADIAYLFHPGAGNPPYYNVFAGGFSIQKGNTTLTYHNTTTEIAELDALAFTNFLWGAPPKVIVMDSSLWSLAKFWQQRGSIDNPTVPESDIQNWCDVDVPQLLHTLRKVYPSSKIIFRTPPIAPCCAGIGQGEDAVEAMVTCIRGHYVDAKLFGEYGLIDYHKIVEDLILKARNNTLAVFRPDEHHPGPEAGRAFMSEVLRYVF